MITREMLEEKRADCEAKLAQLMRVAEQMTGKIGLLNELLELQKEDGAVDHAGDSEQ